MPADLRHRSMAVIYRSDRIGDRPGPLGRLDNVRRMVELEAKKGKRFEIWVTAVGQLKTHARRSFLGPCDEIGSRYSGYGHLGSFPAQLVVKHFINIQVKENPNSPFDYGNLYHGAQ